MEFLGEAINILKILVITLGTGLSVWGVINVPERYVTISPQRKHIGVSFQMLGEI